MKIVLEKRVGGLFPTDTVSFDYVSKLKDRHEVMCEVRRPRNLQHHKKLFAMLKLVQDNIDADIPLDGILDIIKLRTGHVNVWKTAAGEVEVPKSIAFESMDQDAFNEFYERAVRFVLTTILPNIDRPTFERELLEFAA